MTLLKTVIATTFALLFAASMAAASAAAPPRRDSGSRRLDADGSKARDGNVVKVKLADNPPVTAMVKASLADIKQGAFIGVTAMPQPDGSQKADRAAHLPGCPARHRSEAASARGTASPTAP